MSRGGPLGEVGLEVGERPGGGADDPQGGLQLLGREVRERGVERPAHGGEGRAAVADGGVGVVDQHAAAVLQRALTDGMAGLHEAVHHGGGGRLGEVEVAAEVRGARLQAGGGAAHEDGQRAQVRPVEADGATGQVHHAVRALAELPQGGHDRMQGVRGFGHGAHSPGVYAPTGVC